MAQDGVAACNSALQKLGDAPILNLSDGSKGARQCALAFESTRRAELRKHRWNFAITRKVLTPDAVAPSFDYKYAFTLPSDCLRVLVPEDAYCDWVLEGRKILSNDGNVLSLRYIRDVEDVSLWDTAFYDMFSIALAGKICEAITNSTNKKAVLDQEYREARAEARRNNAFEQIPAESQPDSLWLVRL